jgi:hypothetical protein
MYHNLPIYFLPFGSLPRMHALNLERYLNKKDRLVSLLSIVIVCAINLNLHELVFLLGLAYPSLKIRDIMLQSTQLTSQL